MATYRKRDFSGTREILPDFPSTRPDCYGLRNLPKIWLRFACMPSSGYIKSRWVLKPAIGWGRVHLTSLSGCPANLLRLYPPTVWMICTDKVITTVSHCLGVRLSVLAPGTRRTRTPLPSRDAVAIRTPVRLFSNSTPRKRSRNP